MKPSLFEEVQKLTKNQAYIMLGCGIACLVLAAIIIYLFVQKIKSEKVEKTSGFEKKEQGWDKTIKFWKNYIYIFIAFVGIIAGITLLSISIEYLK